MPQAKPLDRLSKNTPLLFQWRYPRNRLMPEKKVSSCSHSIICLQTHYFSPQQIVPNTTNGPTGISEGECRGHMKITAWDEKGNQSASRCTVSITEEGFCCLDLRPCPCWLIPLESQNWSGFDKGLGKNQTCFLHCVFGRHKYQWSSSASHIHPEWSPKLRHVGP